MRDENRPSPEDLLEVIRREESRIDKGKLKIFLGMAAGVGKTYAMLAEAQNLQQEGLDVVVGIVDTHGRQETALLLEGLKQIPPKKITYKEKIFDELDLDEILRLRPQLVLIDELAHSNIPGSRHPKRWQDVMEVLENGIDVYTTLNVQHIESLKDVVEGITGIVIRETVPDLLIEISTFIQLVDLTPDKLLQRLKEGKVYLADQSAIAERNFFQKDRLTALREVALRFTAEKVDHDLHGMVSTIERRISDWKPRERLLVAVDHTIHSQRLIRIARRLAFSLDAPWIVFHVDNGAILDEEENKMLDKNISMARDLGAEVLTTSDPDIAEAIQRIARYRGVTQIIIGRPAKRLWLNMFSRFTLINRLARECSDIDIHVIKEPHGGSAYRKKSKFSFFQVQFTPYFLVLSAVLLLTAVNWLLLPVINNEVVGFIFLIGILFLSIFFKKWPILFAAILFALIWKLFFIPPLGTLSVSRQEDGVLLTLYILTAIVTGILIDRAREHKEMLIKREESGQALYEIVRTIASAHSTEEMLISVTERLGKVLSGKFEILIKFLDNGLNFTGPTILLNDEKDKSAAIWVFENGKEAGWSTSTLPAIKNLYIPLKGFREIVGVLIYRPKNNRLLTIEEKNFLYTVGQQLASFLERSFAEERERQTEQLNDIEKIYQTVLKLISHEFHYPVATIQKAVKDLKGDHEGKEKSILERQIHKIEHTSEGLLRMLDNISAMTKLSTGLIPFHKSLHSIEDSIRVSCEKINKSMNHHNVEIDIQPDLPLIPFDPSLIEILLHNLISNAFEYSPADSTIQIQARQVDDFLVVSISDEGEGIREDLLSTIFEKFYRVPGTTAPGMGLGLAIAKRIAEIHDGDLQAENRTPRGAKFSLFLPIREHT